MSITTTLCFLSSEKTFELGTPQGGVLSPTLFNILLHALLNKLHTKDDELLISYADDIMIQTHCKDRLQQLLNEFHDSSVKCGLVISYAKTKVVVNGTKGAAFSINNNKLEIVSRVRYLGLQVPAGGKVHMEEIKSACMARLGPLKAIAGSTFGANVKIMKDFYIAFIRSVIDYAAPVLINYSYKQMEKLEKIQNCAMRIILGCPMQTRVVNMRKELNLCTLYDRVHMLNAVNAIKVLRESRSTLLQKRIQDGLQNVFSVKNQWLKITCQDLNLLNVDFSAKNITAAPCPWTEQNFAITIPELPAKSTLHPLQMKQLTLGKIHSLIYSNPDITRIIFTDGSLQKHTGRAGSSMVVTDVMFNEITYRTLRIHNWASTLQTEQVGILMALEYIYHQNINALIVCDAKSALLALNSVEPEHKVLSYEAKDWLRKITNQCNSVHLLWTFSHIGVKMHDRADELAKSACLKPDVESSYGIPLRTFKSIMVEECLVNLENYRQSLSAGSCSIKHYDQVSKNRVKYGKYKVKSRLCDLVTARIRLGYMYSWQIHANRYYDPDEVKCRICHQPSGHALQHYIA